MAILFLAGCWGMMGQEIADQPQDVMAKPQEEPEMDELEPGIYWMQGDLKKAGSTIKYEKLRLSKDDRDALLLSVGGVDMVEDWHKNSTIRGWGIGATVGGSVITITGLAVGGIYILAGVVGTIFVAIGGQEAVDKLWADMSAKASVGGWVMLGGTAVMTTGIVLTSVGNTRMRHMVGTCNEAGIPREANISFGPTCSGGIGLTYNF